jgi:hypothetical protein
LNEVPKKSLHVSRGSGWYLGVQAGAGHPKLGYSNSLFRLSRLWFERGDAESKEKRAMKKTLLAIAVVGAAMPLTFAAQTSVSTTHRTVTHPTRHVTKSVTVRKHIRPAPMTPAPRE